MVCVHKLSVRFVRVLTGHATKRGANRHAQVCGHGWGPPAQNTQTQVSENKVEEEGRKRQRQGRPPLTDSSPFSHLLLFTPHFSRTVGCRRPVRPISTQLVKTFLLDFGFLQNLGILQVDAHPTPRLDWRGTSVHLPLSPHKRFCV